MTVNARGDDPETRAAARVGTLIGGKWRLERLLGVGGMAAVYAARHRNASTAAVKLLHREMSGDAVIRGRFLREGYAANTVGHPGAVKVLDDDLGEDGSVFLVMELLEGETLKARAARHAGGALPLPEVLALGTQLLDVLAAAHRQGIVHRDIKPENLFVTMNGTLKVLDFGIARLLDSSTPGATRAGTAVGTPAFMAPEQALGRSDQIGPAMDVWAVGATIFNLLSGQYVHDGETSSEIMIRAATRPAPPLASVLPSIDPTVAAVVDRALRFAHDERWPHAEAFLVELARIPGAATAISPPPARPFITVAASPHAPAIGISQHTQPGPGPRTEETPFSCGPLTPTRAATPVPPSPVVVPRGMSPVAIAAAIGASVFFSTLVAFGIYRGSAPEPLPDAFADLTEAQRAASRPAALIPSPPPVVAAADGDTTVLPKLLPFGVTATLPPGLTRAGDTSTRQGYFQLYQSAGRANVTVGKRRLLGRSTLDALWATASEPSATRTVTYKQKGKDWFVVTGFEGSTIYYARTVASGERVAELTLRFSEAERAEWEPVVGKVGKSLKIVEAAPAGDWGGVEVTTMTGTVVGGVGECPPCSLGSRCVAGACVEWFD